VFENLGPERFQQLVQALLIAANQRSGSLPTEIYSEVLLNPQAYPISFCDAAEGAASRTARKAIKPVAFIAKADRWFVYDQ
jgi:hypothetical protein